MRLSPEKSAERHACQIDTVCRWTFINLAVLSEPDRDSAFVAKSGLTSFMLSASTFKILQLCTSLAKRSTWTVGSA